LLKKHTGDLPKTLNETKDADLKECSDANLKEIAKDYPNQQRIILAEAG
jgi:hypothetical protein